MNSARILREIPIVENKIETGSLSLSAVSQAQVFFKREARSQKSLSKPKKIEILQQLEGQSIRAVDKILLAHASTPAIVARETTRAITDELTELKIVVDGETLADLQRLREIWSHQFPEGQLADIIKKAAKLCREELDPLTRRARQVRQSTTAREESRAVAQDKAESPPVEKNHVRPNLKQTRHIPAKIKSQVWQRDAGACTFKNESTGRICGSRHRLQLDHVVPFGKGGENTVENLRLRCFAHNQWHAIESYGTGVLQYGRRNES